MISRGSLRRDLRRPALVALLFLGLAAAAAQPSGSTYRGIPAGFTAQGDPYLGAPEAPVTMDEWSDYGCPYCRRYFEQTMPVLLDRYVRPGRLRIVLHDYPIADLHPTSHVAHTAARCAGQQGVDKLWALHDALFHQQPQWTPLPDPTAFIAELARGLGIDASRLSACLREGGQADRVAASIKAGGALGLNGTPSFRLSTGRHDKTYPIEGAQPAERFTALIDALLAGKEPVADAAEPPAKPAEMPRWATSEGLAPDPKKPGMTAAGDPYRGSPDAPVSVIEFIDFECPPCRKHALEAQPAIDQALVATGQVRWVSKQLPLRVHPHAMVAAVAAVCAAGQGRYWQMHDLLFQQVDAWAHDGADAALVRLAGSAGLDVPQFTRCFNSRQAVERVLDDMYDARGYIERTPSFAIVDGSARGSVAGPLPAEEFIKLLRKQVEAAASRRNPGGGGAQPSQPTPR